MTRRFMKAATLVAALAMPAYARAHDGHTHKVMGTVTGLDAKTVQVKTPSGEILAIAVNEKTTITRAKKKMAISDVRVGGRVVVDIGNGEDPLIARGIELGAATAAKASTAVKSK